MKAITFLFAAICFLFLQANLEAGQGGKHIIGKPRIVDGDTIAIGDTKIRLEGH